MDEITFPKIKILKFRKSQFPGIKFRIPSIQKVPNHFDKNSLFYFSARKTHLIAICASSLAHLKSQMRHYKQHRFFAKNESVVNNLDRHQNYTQLLIRLPVQLISFGLAQTVAMRRKYKICMPSWNRVLVIFLISPSKFK